jgi:hypothetical protein
VSADSIRFSTPTVEQSFQRKNKVVADLRNQFFSSVRHNVSLAQPLQCAISAAESSS